MLTEKRGAEATAEIEGWANRVVKSIDAAAAVEVYYDADSSTYVLRLAKRNRVLVFRLSEAQVETTGREEECERTLKRKLRDLETMI
ncbi:MAG TPA: hypothetical protein VNO43_05130 [Candidatus Eisenbacteria bacterium]|nr:hypothetical protein [Candidatus Eisenbacteria bacterium]